MKKIALSISALILSLCLNAQDDKFVPNIVPPSPDAAALGKYGQYPVSMSSGVPQIDIPIYTINLPLITVPISISYHASGIKVNEISSIVGLGWALNAGGVITRSTRGAPDEGSLYSPPYKALWTEETLKKLNEHDQVYELYNLYKKESLGGVYDSESDVYYYNMCGMSGSFRFDTDGNLVQTPLSNNKIEYNSSLSTFNIIGSDGTTYFFNDVEKNIMKGDARRITSWYLSEINTIDGKRVSFHYRMDNTRYFEHYVSYRLEVGLTHPNRPFEDLDLDQVNTRTDTENTLILEKITFPGGSIYFTHKTDREDQRKHRLTNIDIKSNKNGIIKAFSLDHSYFPHSRLKLDKIRLLGSNRYEVGCYDFGYNTSKSLPPYYKYNPSTSTDNSNYFGQDLWGYYPKLSIRNH